MDPVLFTFTSFCYHASSLVSEGSYRGPSDNIVKSNGTDQCIQCKLMPWNLVCLLYLTDTATL